MTRALLAKALFLFCLSIALYEHDKSPIARKPDYLGAPCTDRLVAPDAQVAMGQPYSFYGWRSYPPTLEGYEHDIQGTPAVSSAPNKANA